VSIPLIFWWYHVDKREHDYQAGPLMNGGIIAVAVIALPVYFVRTRGWKGGAIATVLALMVLGILFGLSELGEWLGTFFTGPPGQRPKRSGRGRSRAGTARRSSI